jgi:predicted ATP-grasp superfamily ATP-dependent carboligase
VVSGFQHVALTTWPTAAGATARGRSIALDAELVARARDLLVRAGYWGLAAMDFLEGPRGPVLIDINPRYYTSLALALACGVNLPAAWHSITAGTEPPPARPYRTGVTYRWLEAEVLEFAHRLPRRIHDGANGPRTGPMWDPRDPVPGPLLAAHAVASAYRRAANRVGVSFRRR